MIFILGGNGFVGSGFVRHLDVTGVPYTVIDRTNYGKLIGTECDIFINANGNSKKFLSLDDPKLDFQASVVSVRNTLVDFKFKKYIFLSTGDVYPDCSNSYFAREHAIINASEQSPYGFHKYMAELCVQHAAKDWLIIRQGGFVGKELKKNAVFDVLNGDKVWVHRESRFQFINTEQSARLVMELIKLNISNEIFNLTGTGTISVSEIMRMAGRTVASNATAKPVYYEISTDKVAQYITLPSTRETLREFLYEGGD
jgi:nucleoside-diphosphate-sugar epimerase